MDKATCTICAFELTETYCCPACDAADAIVLAGGCHPNYKELLAEQIGNLLMQRDWHKVINLKKMFPRFA
jgi:putative intracellular protease/amidase